MAAASKKAHGLISLSPTGDELAGKNLGCRQSSRRHTTKQMIDLGHMYGDSGEPGNSKLAHYVREQLPEDYMVNDRDLRWLDECDAFLKGTATNESVTAATKSALTVNPKGHVDPFELLIDAYICDRMCEPR
jgi:hypothetical protein